MNNRNYIITISLIIGILSIVAAFFAPSFFINKTEANSYFSQDTGYIGDTIGGLTNPFIGLAGVSFTFLAFYMQKLANDEIKNQFKLQQFENQFFEMVRLHKENVNEMKISGYDLVTEKTLDKKKNIIQITESHNTKINEGRKIFVSMVIELICCYEFLELTNSKWHKKYNREDLLELSYRIFFFGSNSELIVSENIDYDFINEVKEQLKIIRKKHRNSYGKKNIYIGLNKNINLYIKYSPFSGHENRLGHYYRHLYSLVKFVVTKEKEGYFDYKKSREYLKIIRSQMSNDEQLMLYYNYRIGFGADWDYRKKSKNQFLTKYRMLHNLPINRVKYVENPREHFKDFINSIKDSKGKLISSNLFEWGDEET